MTVTELAKLASVTPDAIRYYTHIGLLKPTRNANNNYKQFGQNDVKCLRFILATKRLGFNLAEIAEIMETSRQGNTPCPMVRETIQRRIEENGRALSGMVTLQNRMECALAQWKTLPDGLPDGHAICSLIESIEKN